MSEDKFDEERYLEKLQVLRDRVIDLVKPVNELASKCGVRFASKESIFEENDDPGRYDYRLEVGKTDKHERPQVIIARYRNIKPDVIEKKFLGPATYKWPIEKASAILLSEAIPHLSQFLEDYKAHVEKTQEKIEKALELIEEME
jgi:hypothetical protein